MNGTAGAMQPCTNPGVLDAIIKIATLHILIAAILTWISESAAVLCVERMKVALLCNIAPDCNIIIM
jgi:hypothetical protein